MVSIRRKEQTLEELLVTDELFSEYFNVFLSLPVFPEPICFNRETGGFELVSSARKNIANEIKALIRAAKRRDRIFDAAKCHSYSELSLIPMEEDTLPDEKEVSTIFSVQTLNKEQGIEWVKACRLPVFLNSDTYHEYRLATLLSQSRLDQVVNSASSPEFADIHIIAERRRKVSAPTPSGDSIFSEHVESGISSDESDDETLLKDMYVHAGNTPHNETKAWLNQARQAMNMQARVNSSRPRTSVPLFSHRSTSSRPKSAASFTNRLGDRHGTNSSMSDDSGLGSTVDLLDNLIGDSQEKRELSSAKVRRHRQVDSNCTVLENNKVGGALCKYTPPVRFEEADEFSNVVDATAGNETEILTGDDLYRAMTEIVDHIVTTSLKQVAPEGENENDKLAGDIQLTEDNALTLESNEPIRQPDAKIDVVDDDSHNAMDSVESELAVDKEQKTKTSKKEEEEKKEKDSLLDSDEDEENIASGKDLFGVRKKNSKATSLINRRGILQFRKFLEGTEGEKTWCFWMDIERAKLIRDNDRLTDFLTLLRERYHRSGAPLELSYETKWQLNLLESSDWTSLTKFHRAQDRLIESLLSYWAPSYLLQQSGEALRSNYLYYHQKVLLKPLTTTLDSKPKPLLPLRPKSCVSMLRIASPNVNVNVIASVSTTNTTCRPVTSPAVGVNRIRRRAESVYGDRSIIGTNIWSKSACTDRSVDVEAFTKSIQQATTTSKPGSRTEMLSRMQSFAVDDGIVLPETQMPRMEGLLQALACESDSGHVLRRYIEKLHNQTITRCLDFWEDLQYYHWLFYRDNFDQNLAVKKSKVLHAKYIIVGSEKDIGCDNSIRVAINRELYPPFEDLFDLAEEYALQALHRAWIEMIITDKNNFEKVELIEVNRHLGKTSKYVISMRRRGVVNKVDADGEDEILFGEGCVEPEYDPALIENVPVEFRGITLDKLNSVELENFRQFLANTDRLAAIDFACWQDIEAFRRLPHSEEKLRRLKAKDIKRKYLNKKYFFGPNSPAGREGQEKVVEVGGGWGKFLADVPPTESVLEAQKYVKDRLEKHWLLLFLATPEFIERQIPKGGSNEMVEDLLLQTRKRQQLITRMLESRWVSESKDLLIFRKALSSPITSVFFRRYVSLKGECLENDVLFWQEVQRYKELCHLHSEKALINQKTTAIINCFIDSALSPSLQIDITDEMAEKIIDRRQEGSPYLFREAQLAVFRILYEHWGPFCKFRTNLTDDKVLPTIERHRKKLKAKEKQIAENGEKAQSLDGSRPASVDGINLDGDDTARTLASPLGRTASEDGWEATGSRTNISWSYSQYVKALDKETILSENDESTLSQLSLNDVITEPSDQKHRGPGGTVPALKKDGRLASAKKKEVVFADNLISPPVKTPSRIESKVNEEPKTTQRLQSAKGHRRNPVESSSSLGQGTKKV